MTHIYSFSLSFLFIHPVCNPMRILPNPRPLWISTLRLFMEKLTLDDSRRDIGYRYEETPHLHIELPMTDLVDAAFYIKWFHGCFRLRSPSTNTHYTASIYNYNGSRSSSLTTTTAQAIFTNWRQHPGHLHKQTATSPVGPSSLICIAKNIYKLSVVLKNMCWSYLDSPI
jgi:hypothetical protein